MFEPSDGLWEEGEFSAAEIGRANARGSEGAVRTDAPSARRNHSPSAKVEELNAASWTNKFFPSDVWNSALRIVVLPGLQNIPDVFL
jgi:hypothetical protein